MPLDIKSTSTLLSALNSIQTDDAEKQKRQVGYAVSAYDNLLEQLEKYQTSTRQGSSVLGKHNIIDWEKVASQNYTNSGFSGDLTSGMWKMSMGFHGAFPVMSTTYGYYEILRFVGDGPERAKKMDSTQSYCPYILDAEYAKACPYDDFRVGAFIDVSTLLVQYFNHFYGNADFEFSSDRVNMLFREGYIMGQIVFPSKEMYKNIKIIGHTAISDTACISISSPILGTREWKDAGITMYVLENSKTAKEVAPNGDEYKFACAGETYDHENGTIRNFNKKMFIKQWVENRSETCAKNGEVSLSLQQIPLQECYVRLYVPEKYKSEVISKFNSHPYAPNDFLFSETFTMRYTQTEAAIYSGLAMTLMVSAVQKWSKLMVNVEKFTGYSDDIKIDSKYGTICYGTSGRPHNLVRRDEEESYKFKLGNDLVVPDFGHEKNTNIFDCSSFISFVLWNSGIVRDDVEMVKTFTSDDFAAETIVTEINKYLKPQYEAKRYNLTDDFIVLSGDILTISAADKKTSQNGDGIFGHAAMAFIDSTGKKIIRLSSIGQIGSVVKEDADFLYFKQVVRIQDKQQ